MAKLDIKVSVSGAQEAKLAAIRLTSPAARRAAVYDGGLAAMNVVRGYYARKGRFGWINSSLPTHGPGRVPSQWWRSTETGWSLRQTNSYSVSMVNGTVGLAHKITGGTIRAKRKKFLTIPVTPEAHGLNTRTFSRTIAPLFQAKGMLLFKDPQTDEVKAAYALKRSVTHRPWPGALPPENSYLDAFLNQSLSSLIQFFETT
jgi:hypothetical protein